MKLSTFKKLGKATGGVTGPFVTDSGTQYYCMDVLKDRFVHFTTQQNAQKIVKQKKLLINPPQQGFGAVGVFAVSLVWGRSVPSVQTTHIHKQGHLVAVIFQTDVVPNDISASEEVIWQKDVVLKNVKVVSVGEGKRRLKNAPFPLPQDHIMWYGKGEPSSYWADKW